MRAARGFNNAFRGCNRFNGKLTCRACKKGGLTLREVIVVKIHKIEHLELFNTLKIAVKKRFSRVENCIAL